MAQTYYSSRKKIPLTEEEIKEKYKDIQDEMKEVLKWKKEEQAKLKDPQASAQKKGAAKRALKKVGWRINTVQGQIIYWERRIKGESHFKASLEKNEFWASCREKAEEEQKAKEAPKDVPPDINGKAELPEILKGKL